MPEDKKVILETTLTHQKSTGGTHVFGNEDAGIRTIYLPKLLFKGAKPENMKLKITISVDE